MADLRDYGIGAVLPTKPSKPAGRHRNAPKPASTPARRERDGRRDGDKDDKPHIDEFA